ncbi:MAG TPA: hypothetical protein VFE17_07295 [Candidatus Baltobacteraceae bacterium]|nr:hypothetical protein [Candidatus Baltobacteraceae bacterium]
MTVFRSLSDALHAGYEVVSPTKEGYLVRLLHYDGSEHFALVLVAPEGS